MASERMKPKECERLKGRLQFASGQIFGRKARACLKALGQHARQKSFDLSPKVSKACEHLHDLFFRALPREAKGTLGEVFHCYVLPLSPVRVFVV